MLKHNTNAIGSLGSRIPPQLRDRVPHIARLRTAGKHSSGRPPGRWPVWAADLPTHARTHARTHLGVRVCERVAHTLPFEPGDLEVAECGKVLQIVREHETVRTQTRATRNGTTCNHTSQLRRTRSMD